jgi:hypothetical protein
LKRWLRGHGNYPAKLVDLAKVVPKPYAPIRSVLEIRIDGHVS